MGYENRRLWDYVYTEVLLQISGEQRKELGRGILDDILYASAKTIHHGYSSMAKSGQQS